jgi:hypothetical protein
MVRSVGHQDMETLVARRQENLNKINYQVSILRLLRLLHYREQSPRNVPKLLKTTNLVVNILARASANSSI